jgi:hypothetical protein
MMRVGRSLLYFALLAASVGCSSDWGSSDPPTYRLRLGGRVVNGDTRLPLSGVVVKICNFEATASTDGDGHWFIELSAGLRETVIQLTFERSGFGSVGRQVFVNPENDSSYEGTENRVFMDLGTAEMRPGASATVHVTLDGQPFGSATVYVSPSGFQYEFDSTCTDLDIVVTANSSGVATVPNLDPKSGYDLVVPMQDIDGDNIPDNFSNSIFVHLGDRGAVYGIDVERMTPFGTLFEVGDNLAHFDLTSFSLPTGPVNDTVRSTGSFGFADLNVRSSSLNEEVSFFDAVTTADGSVQIVFATPVTVAPGTAAFLYRNNLMDPTLPGYNEDVRIPATPTALSGSDQTIYNFTPTSALPTNEVVNLVFLARSVTNPNNSANFSFTIYVPIRGNTTIPVRADNYNGSRDGSGGSNQVYLTFDEAVEGFYKILSFVVDNSNTTVESPNELYLYNFDDDAIVHNVLAAPPTGTATGQLGAVAGNAYTSRVRYQFSGFSTTTLFLNDDATTANSITVELSVQDAEGNRFDGILTLPIQ